MPDTRDLTCVLDEETGRPVGFRDAGRPPVFVGIGTVAARINVSQPTLTGTTARTKMAGFILPGGLLGAAGFLRLTALVDVAGTVGTKNVEFQLGAMVFGELQLGSTNRSVSAQVLVANAGALDQQVATAQYTYGNAGLGSSTMTLHRTGTVNTATDQEVAIFGWLSASGDSLTIKAVLCEVFASE